MGDPNSTNGPESGNEVNEGIRGTAWNSDSESTRQVHNLLDPASSNEDKTSDEPGIRAWWSEGNGNDDPESQEPTE